MPVMVWLHGGGFQTGRAAREHHGPDYLMREDVVFVSLNYRLCSLGKFNLLNIYMINLTSYHFCCY